MTKCRSNPFNWQEAILHFSYKRKLGLICFVLISFDLFCFACFVLFLTQAEQIRPPLGVTHSFGFLAATT